MKKKYYILAIVVIAVFILSIIWLTKEHQVTLTNASVVGNLSSKKIEWGIKRNDNHQQPDLGSVNKKIIDELNRYSDGKQRF